jgi:hypothetical protein
MRTVNDATFEDLMYIGSWLCVSDRQELSVTRDPDDYESLATDAWESSVKKVVLDNGEPVLAFGAKPCVDDIVLVWGFKTEKGWSAVRTATKYIRRTMIPELRAMGIRHGVCLVHPDNVPSQRWLTHLGYTLRATLTGIGSRHEDMLLFGWDEKDAPQAH